MKRDQPKDILIAEEAAKWLHELGNGSASTQASFAAWLKESPRHIEETLCATAVGEALDRLEAKHWPDISRHLAAPLSSVVAIQEKPGASATPSTHTTQKRNRSWSFGLAAALVLILASWVVAVTMGSHRYETAVGEQRTLTLEDGSVAYLNTHSKLNVKYSDSTREIQLVSGEALFKVERDPKRPFLVRTDDAVIRALGTQFNVYRRARGTEVSVMEGAIEISSPRGSQKLAAGDAARVAHGTVTQTKKVDIDKTAAWRQRRLVFDLDSLADVAAEFNRYNREPQIRVEGEAARVKRFSGMFDVDDPKALVRLLGTYQDLDIETKGDEIVIRPRPER